MDNEFDNELNDFDWDAALGFDSWTYVPTFPTDDNV